MSYYWNKLTNLFKKEHKQATPISRSYNPDDCIDDWLLPTQVLNTLERNDIYTVADLEKTGKDALMQLRHIGSRFLTLIEEAYTEHTGKTLPLNSSGTITENNNIVHDEIPQQNTVFTTEIVENNTKEFVTISTENIGYQKVWLGDNKYLKTNIEKDIFLDQLGLTQQVTNALAKIGVYTIGDISSVSTNRLWKMKGIGRTSIVKISEELINPSNPMIGGNIGEKDLVTFLLFRLKDAREKDIIIRRYGLHTGEIQTLDEIGHDYKLTRERIRQLEVRAIKKLKHPTNTARNIIKKAAENVILKENGIISDEEADKLLIPVIGNNNFDGSSLLDLIYDLGGLNRIKIGDINLYCPLYTDFNFERITENVFLCLKKAKSTLTAGQIRDLIGLNSELHFEQALINSEDFVRKCCKIHPHIQEHSNNEFSTYVSHHSSAKMWVSTLQKILEKENIPLHFTELANKVNEQLNNDNPVDVRRVHSLLIQNPIFAHVGVKGTYGLVKWGIRKEPSTILAEECIKKAGFPLHWIQILNYVGKYKSTSKVNIRAMLDNSGKFTHKGAGVYDIKTS